MSWFLQATDGMPDLGQGPGWPPSSWRHAPRKQVPVNKLVATNRRGYLNEARAARYARHGARGDIYVIEHAGRYYIADGHHRAVAAMMRREKTITARVKRPGDR
ncbi:ParB/RepB/Spo0J family partition protein [Pseudonocardia zijingensis]|uniref:ParB-like nuclease family protein n=1 Tax=Pseudonocardia zijingensis TaxID=153376 RepID=A0ABP3YTG0_9PSEU